MTKRKPTNLRQIIRARMDRCGVNVSQLARELNLNRANLSAFLSGRRNFPLADIEAILTHLGPPKLTWPPRPRK